MASFLLNLTEKIMLKDCNNISVKLATDCHSALWADSSPLPATRLRGREAREAAVM